MTTAIFFKSCPVEGEITGILSLSLLGVASCSTHFPTTYQEIFPTAPQATEAFDRALDKTLSREWKLVYLGRPLYDQ